MLSFTIIYKYLTLLMTLVFILYFSIDCVVNDLYFYWVNYNLSLLTGRAVFQAPGKQRK